MPRPLLFIGLFFLLTGFGLYRADSYTIGDNYVIRFDGRGAGGTFRGLEGEIVFDPADLTAARMDVSVDATTIETGNKTKDKHARGDAWFDVETYPTIRYVATDFKRTETGFIASGKLTLHGTTKAMPLPFTFERTAEGGAFAGAMTVDRKAFGIKGPWLGFTVGDEFLVELVVPVTR